MIAAILLIAVFFLAWANGANDNFKGVATLYGSATTTSASLALVALAMAVGGWLHSRGVAETMSRHITELNPGQGLTANLMTAAL
jgi:PiT family inorganic phosphate transporter